MSKKDRESILTRLDSLQKELSATTRIEEQLIDIKNQLIVIALRLEGLGRLHDVK